MSSIHNEKDAGLSIVFLAIKRASKILVDIISRAFLAVKKLLKQKPKHRKKIILLVDDEVDLADLIKFQLISKGYNVVATHNGREALKALEKISPDLIILDINMPEMGGVEFYNRISSGQKRSKYPVLVVTARANLEETFRGVEIEGFMTKPFDIGELVKKVAKIISGSMDPVVFLVDHKENPHVKQIGEDFNRERYKVVNIKDFQMLSSEAQKKKPNFIVLEYMQKEMAGDKFIEKIKADVFLKDIPLIVYSYTGFEEYEEKGLRAGADKYLGKPKSGRDFLKAIKELKMERDNES